MARYRRERQDSSWKEHNDRLVLRRHMRNGYVKAAGLEASIPNIIDDACENRDYDSYLVVFESPCEGDGEEERSKAFVIYY